MENVELNLIAYICTKVRKFAYAHNLEIWNKVNELKFALVNYKGEYAVYVIVPEEIKDVDECVNSIIEDASNRLL